MTFLELVQAVEHGLGSHQLPLRSGARGLTDLVDASALHPDLMRRVLAAVFAANHCRRLTDPVERTATLDALGSIRCEIQEAPSSDIDVCRTLDEFCAVVTALFTDNDVTGETDAPSVPVGTGDGANVIPLDSARRFGRIRRDRA
ncbi:MAG: hypothetical protein AABZ50_02950 [Pseudomonadota bacterium]